MAALTGKYPADTYKDLLQVSNSNSGIDGTLRAISDGEGTDSVLYISSSEVKAAGKVTVEFDTGVDAIIGRGTSDTDITYIALRNSAGILCYIYPNSTGNGIVVRTTAP